MEKIRVRLLGQQHSAGRGVGFYRDHLQAALLESGQVEMVDSGEDLIHYPFFDLFYPTLPPRHDKPVIVTIHDATPLVFPGLYPLGIRARLALFSQKRSLRNVSAVLTDSLSSKKDLINYLNLPPESVHVTYLAADPIYQSKPSPGFLKKIQKKFRLPDRFVLYVGGVNPNKNLLRLARVAQKRATPLVLVGSEFTKNPVETFSLKKLLGLQKVHPEIAEFTKLKSLIQNDPLFITPGFVANEDLNAIYRLASLYCQPSLYEGFGLPLLEAMTAGCPIVSSRAGSLPEIYSEKTPTFDPENESQMEKKISATLNLSGDSKKVLIKAGQEKAGQFGWQKTAAATIEIYRSVLGNT